MIIWYQIETINKGRTNTILTFTKKVLFLAKILAGIKINIKIKKYKLIIKRLKA